MRHRPPLTRDELLAIQADHRRNPDVIALLWEIHRLRAIALRAGQLVHCIDTRAQEIELIARSLREQLKGEPVIEEMQALRRELLDPKNR